MSQYINTVLDRLQQYFSKYKPVVKSYANTILEFYLKRNTREQKAILVGSVLLGVVITFSLINSMYSYSDDLTKQYKVSQVNLANIKNLTKNYTQASLLSPNTFTDITNDRIESDATVILHDKDVQIVFDSGNVNISAKHVKFEDLVEFMEQMRASYGAFPDKVQITSTADVDYVSFSLRYIVSN